jgi:hypothetical protein
MVSGSVYEYDVPGSNVSLFVGPGIYVVPAEAKFVNVSKKNINVQNINVRLILLQPKNYFFL